MELDPTRFYTEEVLDINMHEHTSLHRQMYKGTPCQCIRKRASETTGSIRILEKWLKTNAEFLSILAKFSSIVVRGYQIGRIDSVLSSTISFGDIDIKITPVRQITLLGFFVDILASFPLLHMEQALTVNIGEQSI